MNKYDIYQVDVFVKGTGATLTEQYMFPSGQGGTATIRSLIEAKYGTIGDKVVFSNVRKTN